MYKSLTHINDVGEVEGKAQIGICLGNRTGGKTVGHAIHSIQQFEKYGHTTMLLARTAKQMEGGYLRKWWENKILCVNDEEGIIQNFVNSHDIAYSLKEVLVDGKPFSYCEPISMSHTVKDEGAYVKCAKLIMDECVQRGERILMLNKRYAMERIFEIWQTVARGWENAINLTNIVFIANVSDRDNWVCRDLGVNSFARDDTKFTTQKGICYEVVYNKYAADEIGGSLMGQIMKNSEVGKQYYESAQGNEFSDNKAFVVSKGLDFRKLILQLIYGVSCLGVFTEGSTLHIAKIREDSRAKKICRSVEDHREDIKFERYSEMEQSIMDMYSNGLVTFQTLESKNLFLAYCGLIN